MKDILIYLNEALNNTLIWIDDIRDPFEPKWQNFIEKAFPHAFNKKHTENIIWVKSYDEFIEIINKEGVPDYISFDHDLGDVSDPNNEKTGYDCCKYLVDYCIDNNCKFPQYAIQSDNGPGGENIDRYIKNYKKHCE